MEEGASPPRWALDKKLGEDASMEEKKEGEKERGVLLLCALYVLEAFSVLSNFMQLGKEC